MSDREGMPTHPFIQGSIAAALRDVRKCVEALEKANESGNPSAWFEVGRAFTHAVHAHARLNDAVELVAQLEHGEEVG